MLNSDSILPCAIFIACLIELNPLLKYKSSVEMPVLDVKRSLEEAEVMYNALSEISILKDSDSLIS